MVWPSDFIPATGESGCRSIPPATLAQRSRPLPIGRRTKTGRPWSHSLWRTRG